MEDLDDLLDSQQCNNINSLLDRFNSILRSQINTIDVQELIDLEFFDEIKSFVSNGNVLLYFGKTLRDLKYVVIDEECFRQHEIYFQYRGPKRLSVVFASFPHSPLQDREYSTLDELVSNFLKHLEGLAGYFHELECIDRFSTVMEPVNPSFKEEYRRILLDERIWLHVEVTPEGLATNIHLIGQAELWQDKLQMGLLKWDHDLDIVKNIMNTFEMTEFPMPAHNSLGGSPVFEDRPVEVHVCSICLCEELPDFPGVPLPLCQNPTCGIYFHRTCLFQWLVACAGGRPPAFGVATGTCPTCLQPVSCNEKDI